MTDAEVRALIAEAQWRVEVGSDENPMEANRLLGELSDALEATLQPVDVDALAGVIGAPKNYTRVEGSSIFAVLDPVKAARAVAEWMEGQ